jgi:hypothetical protein
MTCRFKVGMVMANGQTVDCVVPDGAGHTVYLSGGAVIHDVGESISCQVHSFGGVRRAQLAMVDAKSIAPLLRGKRGANMLVQGRASHILATQWLLHINFWDVRKEMLDPGYAVVDDVVLRGIKFGDYKSDRRDEPPHWYDTVEYSKAYQTLIAIRLVGQTRDKILTGALEEVLKHRRLEGLPTWILSEGQFDRKSPAWSELIETWVNEDFERVDLSHDSGGNEFAQMIDEL